MFREMRRKARDGARKKGQGAQSWWSLSFREWMLFWEMPCAYCGDLVDGVRLDRYDNDRGYHLDNLMSSCWRCNRMKGKKTYEEFLAACSSVAKHLGACKRPPKPPFRRLSSECQKSPLSSTCPKSVRRSR